jgi:uncharacterized protein Yka (UPF0111/DUF47 family)
MLSFQRLLGRHDEFFGLLEASAAECLASVVALRRMLATPGTKPSLEEFAAARRKDKEITQQLEEMLINTFITPIEREDLEGLGEKLYKIPKTIEKIAERYALTYERLGDVRLGAHATGLELVIEVLLQMLKNLRANDFPAAKRNQTKLRRISLRVEAGMTEAISGLYEGNYPALKAVIVKHLIDLLDKALERSRDAAAVIAHILLKNS